MCECESDDKQKIDSQLNPYECAMLNDFEFKDVHAESAEIENGLFLIQKTIPVSTLERSYHQIQ